MSKKPTGNKLLGQKELHELYPKENPLDEVVSHENTLGSLAPKDPGERFGLGSGDLSSDSGATTRSTRSSSYDSQQSSYAGYTTQTLRNELSKTNPKESTLHNETAASIANKAKPLQETGNKKPIWR